MADLDGPMERLSLRGGRVQRGGGGGGRVMGGWNDPRGGGRGARGRGDTPAGGRGRGDAIGRGGGGWWRGGGSANDAAALPEDDLRHRLNQPPDDLRVKLNCPPSVTRDDFVANDDPYMADRREKLLGRDTRQVFLCSTLAILKILA
jgi:hypothetical protein